MQHVDAREREACRQRCLEMLRDSLGGSALAPTLTTYAQKVEQAAYDSSTTWLAYTSKWIQGIHERLTELEEEERLGRLRNVMQQVAQAGLRRREEKERQQLVEVRSVVDGFRRAQEALQQRAAGEAAAAAALSAAVAAQQQQQQQLLLQQQTQLALLQHQHQQQNQQRQQQQQVAPSVSTSGASSAQQTVATAAATLAHAQLPLQQQLQQLGQPRRSRWSAQQGAAGGSQQTAAAAARQAAAAAALSAAVAAAGPSVLQAQQQQQPAAKRSRFDVPNATKAEDATTALTRALCRWQGESRALAGVSSEQLAGLEGCLEAALGRVRAARQAALDEALLCPACLERRKDMAFGCGHQTCCACGDGLGACPTCGAPVAQRIRLFG